ncbi:hypothetical protein DMB92_09110, partial [Campylobacter sp. MIT 99-7217]|uniref:hypothetical protein n=1 Tax=Campylobacter sp. MIT 99-7217 TaxID=535091 RepID=UPI00115B5B7B
MLGAGGSLALSKGFKALKEKPELRQRLRNELKDSLKKGFENAKKQYPILKTLEPLNLSIMQSEKGALKQAEFVLNKLEKESLEQSKKEALSLLENIKGEALPAKLSEEEFLKNGFSEVI